MELFDVDNKLREASNQTYNLQGLAGNLEARIISLEEVAGKHPPAAEIEKILAATPILSSDADIEARVPSLTQKSDVLQNVAWQLAARVTCLETDASAQLLTSAQYGAKPSEAIPDVSLLKAQIEQKLSVANHQTSNFESVACALEARLMRMEAAAGKASHAEVSETLDDIPKLPANADVRTTVPVLTQKSEALEDVVAFLNTRLSYLEARSIKAETEGQLSTAGQQTCNLEGFATSLEARLMRLEAASSMTHSAEVAEALESSPTLPSNGDLKAQVPVLTKKSAVLESLTHKLGARISFLEASQPQIENKVPEPIQPAPAARGLKEAMPTSLGNGGTTLPAPDVNIEELIRKERLQAEASQIALKEAHALEIARLREEFSKASSVAVQEQTPQYTGHDERIQRLEMDLKKSGETATMYHQYAQELEDKLTAATTQHQQLTTSGESLQMEALTHKQKVLEHEETIRGLLMHKQKAVEHEETIRGLTNETTLLQQTLQEHQEKMSLQSVQFDGERKELLEQMQGLKTKVVSLEESQKSLTAPLSLATTPPAPAPPPPIRVNSTPGKAEKTLFEKTYNTPSPSAEVVTVTTAEGVSAATPAAGAPATESPTKMATATAYPVKFGGGSLAAPLTSLGPRVAGPLTATRSLGPARSMSPPQVMSQVMPQFRRSGSTTAMYSYKYGSSVGVPSSPTLQPRVTLGSGLSGSMSGSIQRATISGASPVQYMPGASPVSRKAAYAYSA